MKEELKEKPPFWFPIAPIMVFVCIYLDLLFSTHVVKWLDLEAAAGIPVLLRYGIGGALAVTGIVFFVWGFVQLRPAAAIGFARRLRDDGAYGLTRNPMYFGLNAAFWGAGCILDDLSVLIAACIWSLLNFLSVTLWEERQMLGKFGEEYLEYTKRVPRFIPLRFKKRAG
ncbi:MAG: isoprenylcysteine carboxylmethyltransferase family protein [Spirochaetes bacterium]|nr:isoprenylcysteine carboxylmethyltransferase family protein [Spirochaetota bacterium]